MSLNLSLDSTAACIECRHGKRHPRVATTETHPPFPPQNFKTGAAITQPAAVAARSLDAPPTSSISHEPSCPCPSTPFARLASPLGPTHLAVAVIKGQHHLLEEPARQWLLQALPLLHVRRQRPTARKIHHAVCTEGREARTRGMMWVAMQGGLGRAAQGWGGCSRWILSRWVRWKQGQGPAGGALTC